MSDEPTKVWFQFDHAAAPVQLNGDIPVRPELRPQNYMALKESAEGYPLELYQYESWRKGRRVAEPKTVQVVLRMSVRVFEEAVVFKAEDIVEDLRRAILNDKNMAKYEGLKLEFEGAQKEGTDAS